MALATVGLVAAWTLLTAFSVTAAVSNARTAADALRESLISEQFELVHESLLAQEDAADAVVGNGPQVRTDYDDAEDQTRSELTNLSGLTDGQQEVAVWLGMHAEYGQAVIEMFRIAPSATPGEVDAYETRMVDPVFDPLEFLLSTEAQQHQARASGALLAMGREQDLLLLLTPVVFGAGLLVLLASTTALRRSRREVAAIAEENRHQAMHDPLTGLPNRMLLRERAQHAFEGLAVEGAGPLALMLVDLNGFKEINDRFGHHSGDVVLQAVAERLCRSVRPTDTVARIGGDEFAVLLPDVGDAETAMVVASSIQAGLTPMIRVDDLRLTIGASLGFALSGEAGNELETLLRNADAAMYRAKTSETGISLHGYPSAVVL